MGGLSPPFLRSGGALAPPAPPIPTPLGLPAILALNLVVIVAEVSENYSSVIFQKYPKAFTGLGTMKGEYTIKLLANAKPHAIYVTRNVPIPYHS